MNVKEVIRSQTHLVIPERQVLSKVLTKRINVFQGKRGNWKGKPVNLELRPGAEPIAAIPFPVM